MSQSRSGLRDKALKIAFQMDAFEKLNFSFDSSLLLAQEAQDRGYDIFHYLPSSLTLKNNRLFAKGSYFKLADYGTRLVEKGPQIEVDLQQMDVILIRQDPPYDMAYLTSTYLLDLLVGKVLILNHPASVRSAPEKILMAHFPDLIPATMMTRDLAQIEEFKRKHKQIVLKPLFAAGGFGVTFLDEKEHNLPGLLDLYLSGHQLPIIAQEFIPQVVEGDKRIILVNGTAVGALNRVPQAGQFRANLHIGGKAHKTSLTQREKEICETIAPYLKAHDLFLVGIDVIAGYLTEINVTSPTGLRPVNEFDQIRIEQIFWDQAEEKLKKIQVH